MAGNMEYNFYTLNKSTKNTTSLRYTISPSTVFCHSSIYNKVFVIFVQDCTPSLWKYYMTFTNLHWLSFILFWNSGASTSGYHFGISSNRLFEAVRVVCESIDAKNRPFLNIKFANKGIDALISATSWIKKSVKSYIPPYFANKESPCISYSYTSSVAIKIFNYHTFLQQIDFHSLSQNPLPCFALALSFFMLQVAILWQGDSLTTLTFAVYFACILKFRILKLYPVYKSLFKYEFLIWKPTTRNVEYLIHFYAFFVPIW